MTSKKPSLGRAFPAALAAIVLCLVACSAKPQAPAPFRPWKLEIGAFSKRLSLTVARESRGKNIAISPYATVGLVALLAGKRPPANISNSDFANFTKVWTRINPPPADQVVNAWIRRNGGTDVLPVHFDSGAILIAASLTTFSGTWERAFDPNRTSSRPFVGVTTADVPVMAQNGIFAVAESFKGLAVALNYTDGLTMVLYAPRHPSQTPLETFLNDPPLTFWRDSAIVLLPRFSMRSDADITGPLRALGETAFGTHRLARAVNNTYLKIDERGTKVESVAVGEAVEKVAPCFCFTRPFAFALIDPRNPSTPILIGQYVDPKG